MYRHIAIKVWREPDWARGRYFYEFKDDQGNTHGASGLTVEMLLDHLSHHFEDEEFKLVTKGRGGDE